MIADKLKPATFKHIEAELYGYPDTKREIHRRREEIMNTTDQDENTGQGKNSYRTPGRPTERIATRLTMDKRLRNLEEIVGAIDRVHNRSSNDYQKLIELKYWSRRKALTWEGIADKLHVSRRQAMRWRDEIIHTIAEVLGWR